MYKVLTSLKSQELNKIPRIQNRCKILDQFPNNQKNRVIVIQAHGNKCSQTWFNKHIKRIGMKEVNHNKIQLKLILFMI